jgi:microcompartment protein CcmK/EutM
MQLARVIGTCVCTQKHDRLMGATLLVIQPITSAFEDTGEPLVAVDTVGAGNGEVIFYAKSKEAAFDLPDPEACVDAGIIGIVESVNGKYGRQT